VFLGALPTGNLQLDHAGDFHPKDPLVVRSIVNSWLHSAVHSFTGDQQHSFLIVLSQNTAYTYFRISIQLGINYAEQLLPSKLRPVCFFVFG